jgi:hypothetical protein
LNVSIFGLNLRLAHNCSIYLDKKSAITGMELFEYPPTIISQGNVTSSILCFIPERIMKDRTFLYVTLKNKQGELNLNGYIIEFYDPPTLINHIPSSGASFGGGKITVFGVGIVETRKVAPLIYCKFGNIFCEKPCDRVDSQTLVCDIQAHPPGEVTFSMSYNKVDWHPIVNSTRFSYTTCDAGYTADNYKSPCQLCLPGTYKPSNGLYECIKCGNDTFSSFSGSLLCEKCPSNTTGIEVGSITHQNCLCNAGFYLNPEYNQHSGAHKKCVKCPPGAFCNFNASVPLALPGYWNSPSNLENFYSCLPRGRP